MYNINSGIIRTKKEKADINCLQTALCGAVSGDLNKFLSELMV